jgi:ribose-phosphate pyrophosphokinase
MIPILFSGSAHPLLAEETAYLLKTTLGKRDIHIFPDHEIFVEILEPVLGKDVFVIQALKGNLNSYLMELFIMLDALKRAGAQMITVVLPYYGYSRQDRLDKPGVSITAKLIADLLTQAGAQRLITMDLHSEQIEGFFDIPVDHLHSRHLMISHCKKLSLDLKNAIVVAPDKGGIKIASAYAQMLDIPLALIDKERIDPFHVEMRLFLGDVAGKTVLLTDDMCATGGTLVHAAQVCMELGAKRVIGIIGHGLFLENALEKIMNSRIEFVLVTNSVPIPEEFASHPKLKIVSIAPLLAEAIQKNCRLE